MADLEQLVSAKVPALKAYHALATPTAAQQTAIIDVLVQVVAMMIMRDQHHPDDRP